LKKAKIARPKATENVEALVYGYIRVGVDKQTVRYLSIIPFISSGEYIDSCSAAILNTG
jgi:hypothetical protein